MTNNIEQIEQNIATIGDNFKEVKSKYGDSVKAIGDLQGKVDSLSEKQIETKKAIVEEQAKIMQEATEQKARMDKLENLMNQPAIAGFDTKAKETLEKKNAHEALNYFIKEVGLGQERHSLDGFLRVNKDLLEKKDVRLNVGEDGGFFVEPYYAALVRQVIREDSDLRLLASVVSWNGTDEYIIPKFDNDEPAINRNEGQITNDYANTITYKEHSIKLHEKQFAYNISRKVLELRLRNGIDLASQMSREAARGFMIQEEGEFFNGDGVNGARGFLTYPNGTNPYGQVERIASGTDGSIGTDMDAIIRLQGSLKMVYARNATFAMSRAIFTQVQLTKTAGQGYIVYDPKSPAGLSLNGRPVAVMEAMPEVATGSIGVVLADWKQFYVILDGNGVSLLVDPYTQALGLIRYMHSRYVGGDVNVNEAGKFLQLSTSI